jgi:hypothetical protein
MSAGLLPVGSFWIKEPGRDGLIPKLLTKNQMFGSRRTAGDAAS